MRVFAVQWNIVFRTVTEANVSGGSGLLEEECLCCRENTLAQVSDLWVPKCCHEYGNIPLILSLENCTAKPPHGVSPSQHMQATFLHAVTKCLRLTVGGDTGHCCGEVT